MSREDFPSNAVWISENNPAYAWAEIIETMRENPSAVAVWDTLPVISDPAVTDYILRVCNGNSPLNVPIKEYHRVYSHSEQGGFLERFQGELAKHGLSLSDHVALGEWHEKMKSVLTGLSEVSPNSDGPANLRVGSEERRGYSFHADVGVRKSDLNLAWTQAGPTTVFLDKQDIAPSGNVSQVTLNNDRPTLWSAPKGALTVFSCDRARGAVHSPPVMPAEEARAFFRMRITP